MYDALFLKIQNLSERASIESRTSYDEYIRLFAMYFEQSFRHPSVQALRIASEFGYLRPGKSKAIPRRRHFT